MSKPSVAGKLNTAPLGGMRDHLPLDVLRRAYVTEHIERVYQSYGFEPLETPASATLTKPIRTLRLSNVAMI